MGDLRTPGPLMNPRVHWFQGVKSLLFSVRRKALSNGHFEQNGEKI